MTDKKDLLMCDPETGTCEIPSIQDSSSSTDKKIRILYFTDPICSSCWGIEPQLRKLKLEYGDFFDIEYKMGGLLPGWDVYSSGGISSPANVAEHWDEAGAYYQMPIDGDLWLEDPLPSSYPPSIAFKAAQLQDKEKSMDFFRRIKEMIFMEKKNIAKWEHLEQAALDSGLDPKKLKEDFEGIAVQLFEEDLKTARRYNVRGFPTLFFVDEDDNQFKVYGSKPYEQYEQALLKLIPEAVRKDYDTSYQAIFSRYPTLTVKEYAILTGQTLETAEAFLNDLYTQKKADKYSSKQGNLWRLLYLPN